MVSTNQGELCLFSLMFSPLPINTLKNNVLQYMHMAQLTLSPLLCG